MLSAVVGLIGLIGVGWLISRSGSTAVTSFAEDPSGSMFVLPDEASGYALTNGQLIVDPSVEPPDEIVVLGTRNGVEIQDLSTVRSTVEEPAVLEPWTEIETEAGLVRYSVSPHLGAVATRFSNGRWLTVRSAAADLDRALAILADTTVGSDGGIELGSETLARLVERVSFEPSTEVLSTYAEVVSSEPTLDPIVVETGAAPSPLIAVVGGSVTETMVHGLPAWTMVRSADGGATWVGLAWSVSPNRIVAVSGLSAEDVRAVAESLRPVTEAEWRTQTGAPEG